MGEINVGGERFWVERVNREKTETWYRLQIKPSSYDHEYPDHIFQTTMRAGSRSELSDEMVEEALREWREKFPDIEIEGFAISEETTARTGYPEDVWHEVDDAPSRGSSNDSLDVGDDQ